MGNQLALEQIVENSTIDLGPVSGSELLLGREPDAGGLVIESSVVSRNHGSLSRVRSHWFYRDLGSTNGSWVNGTPISPGQWILLRTGDVIQLADVALRVKQTRSDDRPAVPAGTSSLERSLLVFDGVNFLDEYPIPEYGKALVIGGAQGDLDLRGQLDDQPVAIIERRGMKLELRPVSGRIEMQRNGEPIRAVTDLADRARVTVANYQIIVNVPGESSLSELAGQNAKVRLREWDAEGNRGPLASEGIGGSIGGSNRGIFGKRQESPAEAGFGDDRDDLIGADVHPSARFAGEKEDTREYSFQRLEEKIVVMIGAVLLLALVALTLYWVIG